ncbi:hypothetical protein [Actinomadura rubrisoli]|uniref:Uncharacterized protein n=1 Tax=Actinomadura rubrisoli TaxID=2530368 RepID=A0A4R5CGL0_9ACTN|nr:hypothetical protein [Actinomadura rubrisoli]TDD97610.1 hypothetical protein E1298_00845 [Actinomadura rubrisoli]
MNVITLACDCRDRLERFFRWRAVHRVGYDPAPALGGGRYYLAIGTRGWRTEHEYELSRDDMEMLGEAISDLLATTRPNDRGGWQWFDPETEETR